MKHFIFALCCLAVVAAVCIYGTFVCTRVIDDILEELQNAPVNLGDIPENATAVSSNVLGMWAEDFFVISMFHPHQHLDEVKEKMVSLYSYAKTGEYAEWAEAHAHLREALLHLRSLLEANIDNIL